MFITLFRAVHGEVVAVGLYSILVENAYFITLINL